MATQSVKDILNTEIPSPAWTYRPSRAAPLRSDMSYNYSGVGRLRRDVVSGKYDRQTDGSPRIVGNDASLVVQPEGYTEEQQHATDPSQWFRNNTTGYGMTSAFLNDPFLSEDARFIANNGSNAFWAQVSDGNVTATATSRVMFEKRSGSFTARLEAREQDNNNTTGTLEFEADASGNLTVNSTSSLENYGHRHMGQGPNGGALYALEMTYTVPSGRTDEKIANRMQPISSGAIFHQQSIREDGQGHPRKTKTAALSRAGETVTIFDSGTPPWWNPDQGTFYIEFTAHGGYKPIVAIGDRFFEEWIKFNPEFNAVSITQAQDGVKASVAGTEVYKPLRRTKVAASSSAGVQAITVNGSQSKRNTFDASTNDGMLSPDNILIGDGSGPACQVHEVRYYPRFLSQKQRERLTT